MNIHFYLNNISNNHEQYHSQQLRARASTTLAALTAWAIKSYTELTLTEFPIPLDMVTLGKSFPSQHIIPCFAHIYIYIYKSSHLHHLHTQTRITYITSPGNFKNYMTVWKRFIPFFFMLSAHAYTYLHIFIKYIHIHYHCIFIWICTSLRDRCTCAWMCVWIHVFLSGSLTFDNDITYFPSVLWPFDTWRNDGDDSFDNRFLISATISVAIAIDFISSTYEHCARKKGACKVKENSTGAYKHYRCLIFSQC